MLEIVSRARREKSICALVLISPATTTRPVVTIVSHATRPVGSSARTASSTLSLIWSDILSGCPSVTDSDVKVCLLTTSTLGDQQRRYPVQYQSGQRVFGQKWRL